MSDGSISALRKWDASLCPMSAAAAVAVGVSSVAFHAAVGVLARRVRLARGCAGVFTDDPPTLPLIGGIILCTVGSQVARMTREHGA